ncbi:MAG TPA: nitroreductase/quinone reductase family protein [Anaerolineales bacterium]|jgi:deazaflavin-dependent oxidoreductase (nitroreductase family)
MTFNDFASWLLRSRLNWMMGADTMLIRVTGRKTGRELSLPVNFHRDGAELWVISSRNRTWWRNLKENPRARVWIAGREMSACAELVLDEPAVVERLSKLCTEKKWLAKALHIGLDEGGVPQLADLQREARERMFVHLRN